MRFSVAPTLANSSVTVVPRRPWGRISVDVTVGGIELNAQGLKTKNVHIDLASAQVAAARHGDLTGTKAAQQCAEKVVACAHLA